MTWPAIALLVAGALAVESLPGAASEPIPSASSILDHIKSDGARTVYGRLWSTEAKFDAICNAIEGADPKWLEVAAHLRPVSDGAAALSLNFSVARALPHAPNHVLALVGHGFALEDLCTSPFIEAERGVAEDYEKRALAALATVSDPRLKPFVEQCAGRVRQEAGDDKFCPVTDEQFFEQLTTMKDWPTIYAVFKHNFPACSDDGIFGEGYTDAVVVALAKRWSDLGELENFVARDTSFRRFVYRHINASADEMDLRRVLRNARTNCPADSSRLCGEIVIRAKTAIAQAK